MTLLKFLSALSVATLTTSCAGGDVKDDTAAPGDDSGVVSGDGGMPDYQECDDSTATLASSDISALGFSADDVLTAVAGPSSASGTWTDGGAITTVTLAVSLSGAPVFHDRSPTVDTGTGMEGPDSACPDWLEVPVSVTFATDDGAFDETLSASILAMELSSLWASSELDWTALSGTYTFTDIDPAEWDTVGLSLSAGWSGGATTGQVDMSASRSLSEDTGGGVATGEGIVGPVLRW